MNKRILVFCDFYLPGFKSGGGMWTVANLVDRFHDKYDFNIVTRNYDSRDDMVPYTSVSTGVWNTVGNATVFYAEERSLNQVHFARLVNGIKPDVVFLNSVFSTPAVQFLRARMRKIGQNIPVIIAPCGEMSKAALSLKPLKKKLFLRYASIAGMYRDVIWKASARSEVEEIKNAVGQKAETWIAPDLPPRTIIPDYSPSLKPEKQSGSVRFAFVSRLVRKKNLHFFLELLKSIRLGNVYLDIIGPLEDTAYWRECLSIIDTLPDNVKINVTGPMRYDDALKTLCKAHFFVLPTLNENFGYVFIEALSAGCPLLISDRTMWKHVGRHNAGWTLPLEKADLWLEKIACCIKMDSAKYQQMSAAARNYALTWLGNPEIEEATERVLNRAINGKTNPSDNEHYSTG
ncbi:MAG: glycosyltransferase family 4 protein [Pyrinomonadaceae bacterium]